MPQFLKKSLFLFVMQGANQSLPIPWIRAAKMSDDPTTMLNASSTASVSSTTGVGSAGGEDDVCGGVMDEEYNRWEDLPKKRKETLRF